jgi:hypothetical protein
MCVQMPRRSYRNNQPNRVLHRLTGVCDSRVTPSQTTRAAINDTTIPAARATVDKINKLVIGFAALWVLSHLTASLMADDPGAVALIPRAPECDTGGCHIFKRGGAPTAQNSPGRTLPQAQPVPRLGFLLASHRR